MFRKLWGFVLPVAVFGLLLVVLAQHTPSISASDEKDALHRLSPLKEIASRYSLPVANARVAAPAVRSSSRSVSMVDDRQGGGRSLSASSPTSPGLALCSDGTVHDLQHLDLGQKQIATVGGDHSVTNVHFAWTHWDVVNDSIDQIFSFINYQGYNPSTGFCLSHCGVTISGAGADPLLAHAAFVNVDVMSDDYAALFFHQRNAENQPPESDQRFSSFALDQGVPCFNLFNEHELPLSDPGEVMWPHGVVDRGGGVKAPGDDVFHVTAHPSGNWASLDDEIHYWRRVGVGGIWEGPAVLDINAGPVNHHIAADPTTENVAVIYNQDGLDPSDLLQVVYMLSPTNGADWIAAGVPVYPDPLTSHGFSFIPVTNYTDPDGEQAWMECGGEYDLAGRLHVFWIEQIYANVSPDCRLRHWVDLGPKRAAISSTVAQAIGWDNQGGHGERDLWLASPGMAFGDGQTECSDGPDNPFGGNPHSNRNYAYIIYEQYGGETAVEQADVSSPGNQQNLELYLSVSNDYGVTWSPPVNLTDTRTPGCNGTPGNECASEREPSIALTVNNAIHIQYIRDIDAGDAMFGQGDWTFNPVMYLKIGGPESVDPDTLCPEIAPSFAAQLTNQEPGCEYYATQGGQQIEELIIENNGSASMTGVISTDSSDWLLLTTGTYTIPAGGPADVRAVTLDAQAPSIDLGGEGLYQEMISITHNDPTRPSPYLLPVDFYVFNDYTCEPEFAAECEGYLLEVACGDLAAKTISVIGGTPPYEFEVFSGPGEIDQSGNWTYQTDCDMWGSYVVDIQVSTSTQTAFCEFVLDVAPSPCECPYQSDFDEDEFLTALDLSSLIDILFSGAPDVQDSLCPTPRGDFDCDNFTTALDLSGLIDHLFVGADGPCVPCVQDPKLPKCDNCHIVIDAIYECHHWASDRNGAKCNPRKCIQNFLNTATCDRHPKHTGTPECDTDTRGKGGLVVQRILDVPDDDCESAATVAWRVWYTLYKGCNDDCIPMRLRVACETELCFGNLLKFARRGDETKCVCP